MVILVLLKSSEIEIYEKSGIYTLKFQKISARRTIK